MKSVQVHLSDEAHEALKEYAFKLGKNQSETIEHLLLKTKKEEKK